MLLVQEYTMEISEAALPNTQVLQLLATDQDTGMVYNIHNSVCIAVYCDFKKSTCIVPKLYIKLSV